MRQRRSSINEVTCASQNSVDTEKIRQRRASRDKATRTSQNTNEKELFIQRRSLRNKSTFSSQNVADSKRMPFFGASFRNHPNFEKKKWIYFLMNFAE